jgi:hypothetical protein
MNATEFLDWIEEGTKVLGWSRERVIKLAMRLSEDNEPLRTEILKILAAEAQQQQLAHMRYDAARPN